MNITMKTVYYIEDDGVIASAVQVFLRKKGYEVHIFDAILPAKTALQKEKPSLVLIDWNLPDGNGHDLCKWIRKSERELSILFLTVKSDSKDIIQGFQAGADDYLTKPFDLEVLYARICAILRRTGVQTGDQLTCGNIVMDKTNLQVFISKEEVLLSQTEYQLLKLLLENKGCILTRTRLLEELWDRGGNYVNDNTLTVAMKRLREKLGDPPNLKTVRSFGYRMEES